jgi:hypothetical protein
METEFVHISKIKHGDTILHYGEMKTVSRKYIKTGGFCGTAIYGDSYRSGTLPVERVVKF